MTFNASLKEGIPVPVVQGVVAGNGLTLTGATLDVGETTGIVVNPDNVGLDLTFTDHRYMRWVPYTGSGQAFLNQDMTRDGDWTMIANKDTTTRPAPQETGSTEDLLPMWTPATLNARAGYTVANEWTLSQGGWIDQYGVNVNSQNVGAIHVLSLSVNGTVRDTLTVTPNTAGLYLQNITPLIVGVGSLIRVSVQVTQISNNYMYWDQQPGLFTPAPIYCSLAQGQKDGGVKNDTAYDCHCLFIPGAFSPDWDIVAYGGSNASNAVYTSSMAVVEGSKGDNEALTSLIAALAKLGLVTDNTT